MEENRKGPGIFYAVVGVATLVVAIIGATFAFFSASASNGTDIKGTTAQAGGLNLKVTPLTKGVVDGKTANMIPLNINDTETKNEQFAQAITNGCVDKNGNRVCQIYAIKVANKSNTAKIQVTGELSLKSDAQNVMWKLIELGNVGTYTFTPDGGAGTEEDHIEFVNGTTTGTEVDAYAEDHVATADGKTTGTGFITVEGNSNSTTRTKTNTATAKFSQDLGFTAADCSHVYYVLVWLEETGAEQEDDDANKSYEGTVTFSAVDANGHTSGLTASF